MREARKKKKRDAYHSTQMLLKNYRKMVWVFSCYPEKLLQELEEPSGGSGKVRLLLDRLNEAMAVLRTGKAEAEMLLEAEFFAKLKKGGTRHGSATQKRRRQLHGITQNKKRKQREEYFPFVSKAFTVMQYTAWAILFLVTVWQLFRVFGGPITEAENPWVLLARSSLFALLIGYAKQIFLIVLDIACAPYTALMEIAMTAEDFTFVGVENVLMNGLMTVVAIVSVAGLLLLIILKIALG